MICEQCGKECMQRMGGKCMACTTAMLNKAYAPSTDRATVRRAIAAQVLAGFAAHDPVVMESSQAARCAVLWTDALLAALDGGE